MAAAGSSLDRHKSAARPATSASDQRSRKHPCPSIRNAAAQTRIVSLARIRLDSRKSVRSFKGIICVDISEFESYMPSQAVASLWVMFCNPQGVMCPVPTGRNHFLLGPVISVSGALHVGSGE
jgi:hypothetical protein